MRSVSQIVDALKNLLSIHTDTEIANLLGVKAKTLAAAKVRNNYPFVELIAVCSKKGISLNWLLSGEGDPTLLKGALDPVLVSFVIETTEKRLRELKAPNLLTPEQKGKFVILVTAACQKDDSIIHAKGEKQKNLIKDQVANHLRIIE